MRLGLVSVRGHYLLDCTLSAVKFGGGRMILWGGPLYSSEGKSKSFSLLRHLGHLEDPFLFQHDCALEHKARSMKAWIHTIHASHSLGWKNLTEPQRAPDLISSGWMGNSNRHIPKSCRKPSQKSCCGCKGGTNSLLMPMHLEKQCHKTSCSCNFSVVKYFCSYIVWTYHYYMFYFYYAILIIIETCVTDTPDLSSLCV